MRRPAFELAPAVAVALAAVFVATALPVLDTLPHDFDEGWLMLDARFVADGQRPFVDFPHHETPLHLYLLALAGEIFGRTIFGYRMLSVTALAASGFVLFRLARPFVGALPALLAEALFLFSPVQSRASTAVPETPALFLTLVGVLWIFTRTGRVSAWASGIVFVAAALTKPTVLVPIAAAVLGLAVGREWRRLADLAAAGIVAGVVGILAVVALSDGVFAEVVRFQVTRVGTHRVGMWAIDSGFADMKQILGIETPRQWAMLNFRTFFLTAVEPMPILILALGLLAIPVWIFGCARARPAFGAFVALWPAGLLWLNFLVMDFVSPRYFIPCFAFAAFLAAGWAWLLERIAGTWVVAGVGGLAIALLVSHYVAVLGSDADPWFWGRSHAIAPTHGWRMM